MGSGSRKNSAVVILIVAARDMNGGGVELIKRPYPRFAQKVGWGKGFV